MAARRLVLRSVTRGAAQAMEAAAVGMSACGEVLHSSGSERARLPRPLSWAGRLPTATFDGALRSIRGRAAPAPSAAPVAQKRTRPSPLVTSPTLAPAGEQV